jgi:hypothetical protein
MIHANVEVATTFQSPASIPKKGLPATSRTSFSAEEVLEFMGSGLFSVDIESNNGSEGAQRARQSSILS